MPAPIAEWGLALALESRMGAERRQILLDSGDTPDAYNNNLQLVGIDPSKT